MLIKHFVAIMDLGDRKLVYHDNHHDDDEIRNTYKQIIQNLDPTAPALFNLRVVYSDDTNDKSLAEHDSYFNNAIYYHDWSKFLQAVQQGGD